MDPLTHAASGAAAMLAFSSRPATRWAAPLAALACASPDIDLVFIHTPLEFLLLHRGITHSFAFMPFFGLALALCCQPLWSKKTPGAWSFRKVWLFCCGMILLHIWLDVTTTYGTMVFLPFSHYRVRLNSLYIIDPAITLPLLWTVCFRFARPKAQIYALIWIFIWPALGIGLNHLHKERLLANFKEEKLLISDVHILPDAFAPFFWRAIYRETDGQNSVVHSIGLNWLGKKRGVETSLAAAPDRLEKSFRESSRAGEVFFDFVMLPVMQPLPEKYRPQPSDDALGLMFYDLRFGSDILWVRKLLALRPNAELPFLFLAELDNVANPGPENIRQIRLRFADSGHDSMWHKPERPQPPTWGQWLLGLY